MKKKLFIALVLTTITSVSFVAQTKEEKEAKKKADRELKLEMGKDLFESVYTAFSSKKISTVTLKDGRIIQGYKTGIKQKSGLILSIEIEDSISKKKEKFTAEQISEMYLYPSGFQKSLKMQSFFGNVNNYGRKNLNKIVSQGYIYIKNQEVSIKNKKEKKEYLMQLINPEFSSIIEVYGDPMAKETGGVSFGGGPTIGGGVTKSYYVKKGDKVYWLEKKDFNDYYNELFGDCKEFMNKYPLESADWRNLGYLILEYTKLASEEK